VLSDAELVRAPKGAMLRAWGSCSNATARHFTPSLSAFWVTATKPRTPSKTPFSSPYAESTGCVSPRRWELGCVASRATCA
jgi:hypothetical protein